MGGARFSSGDVSEARAAFEAAAAEARALGAREHLARAALGFTSGQAAGAVARVDPEAVGLLEEALDHLRPADDALRSAVLGQLAIELYWSGDERRLDSLSSEAVARARRTGDRVVLADALSARRFAVWGPDTLEERLAIGTEILRLTDEIGPGKLTLRGQEWRIADLLEAGELDAVRREISAQTRFAEATREPLDLWVATAMRGMQALFEGRLESAEHLATEAYAIGRRVYEADAAQQLAAQLGCIRRDQGRTEEIMDAARSYTEGDAAAPASRCFVALCSAELGQDAEARRELGRWAADAFPKGSARRNVALLADLSRRGLRVSRGHGRGRSTSCCCPTPSATW